MVRNYTLIAFRNLLRNKAFSLLNIFGLAIGMAAAITIGGFIIGELKVDRFQKEAANTYLLYWLQDTEDGTRSVGLSTLKEAETLRGNLASITDVINVRTIRADLESGDQKFRTDVLLAQKNFFSFFSFELIEGDPVTALNDPSSVIVTQELAQKYFGNASPIGKALRLTGDFEVPLKVTGVVKNYPDSHLEIGAIVNWEMKTTDGQMISQWYRNSVYTYIKTGSPMAASPLAAEINQTFAQADYDLEKEQPGVISVAEIYLGASRFDFMDGYRLGNKSMIKTLGAVGLLTLIMACINFINASTAQSMKRAKEVGIRKTMGASSVQLRIQFLLEAFLIVGIAAIVGITIADMAKPFFAQLSGKTIYFNIWSEPAGFLLIGSIFVFTALFSGVYPSVIMSTWTPVESLKGKLMKGKDSRLSREVLITFQFVVTVCLIAGSLLIYRQNQYMLSKDLGFNKEQVIVLRISQKSTIFNQQDAFLQEISTIPSVVSASAGMDALGDGYTNNSYFAVPEGGTVNQNGVMSTYFTIDDKFHETYGIGLVSGRFLNGTLASDSNAVVINESLAKGLGYGDPINRTIKIWGDDSQPYRVVGVLKDFHFQSLHKQVQPALCILNQMNGWNIAVRMDGSSYQATIAELQTRWEAMEKEAAFNYAFLNDSFARFYQTEQRLLSAINFFSLLSIVVASIGLYGLTSFMVQQRTKEIGIRKVMGATVPGILVLLNRRLMLLLLVALVIATPLTLWFVGSWLSAFAYQAGISWTVFGIAGFLVGSVIVLTVIAISLNTVRKNPVKALRYE